MILIEISDNDSCIGVSIKSLIRISDNKRSIDRSGYKQMLNKLEGAQGSRDIDRINER